MDLALDATDDADGFTKVCLSMPRRMHQRHEHLFRPQPPAGHIILHNRDAACEAVFVPKPLKDPLRRMLLLLRSRLVVPKNASRQMRSRYCTSIMRPAKNREKTIASG